MTRDLGPAPLRCLLVWLAVTAGATALGLALVPHVLASLQRPAAFDTLLVACCEAALVAAGGWAWVVTGVVVHDAARGHHRRRRGVPAPVRRALLAACGTALAGSLAAPSYATAPVAHRDDRPASVLQGLPLPERASTALHVARLVAGTAEHAQHPHRATPRHRPGVPQSSAPRPRTVVVTPGDTLWALAAASLPPGASDADVAARVALLHRTNRATVGPDPDLVLPGQELRLPRR